MTDASPPGYSDNPSSPTGAQSSGSGSSKGLMIGGMIVALIVVALAGFFVGKSNGESQYDKGKDKYNEIYNAGASSGQEVGESQGQAQGEKSGKVAGAKAGLEQGKQQGQVTGANDVFDAYSTGWQVGDFYIVQIGEGSGGVDYTLENRLVLAQDTNYSICQDNSDTICTAPVLKSSSSEGTGGSD